MNVHHVELFYYVAKAGGISAAVRQMPYGIQQPAISAQIMQLEDSLGVTLFQRRPFALTREGQHLYDHVRGFFDGLDELELRLRGGSETRLRLVAPEIVQREYLPGLLARLKKRIKGFHFTLTGGRQREIETLLLAGEADMGLAVLAEKPAPGIHTRELLRLEPVLLVPEKSRFQNADELLALDRIDLPLITQESTEVLPRKFQSELDKRRITWPVSLELGGLDIIGKYVAQGFGVGLAVRAPGIKLATGVRELPLKDFHALSFSLVWRGQLTPVQKACAEELEALAGHLVG